MCIRDSASGARRSRTPAAPVRTITGVLTTADGHPIGGAALRVLSRLRTGSEFTAAGRIKTGRHGRFTYTVPQGPSRTIRFRYDGTDFTLNWLPFGGFARMKGEDAGDMTPGSFNAASRAGAVA